MEEEKELPISKGTKPPSDEPCIASNIATGSKLPENIHDDAQSSIADPNASQYFG